MAVARPGTFNTDRTVMYEQNFGLKKRLFRAVAVGPDVFVGPQTATAMASLKKTLKSDGAIVTISGPAGSGKTTLVGKALMAIGENKTTVLIGRIRLDINDVLDLLLKELDIKPVPSGTFQKFAAFRQTLYELESRNSRLVVVVEDAARMGAETLAELEALTAADAGPSEGANIVIMADEQLDHLLRVPQLARLKQRIRQRLTIDPLPASELHGYLRHCFRLAGGDFEQIFSDDAAALLHHLSGGIPRIANNLVESTMKAAAVENQQQVPFSLLSKVAEDEYGLSSADFTAMTSHAAVAESTPKPGAARNTESAPELKVEPKPESLPKFESVTEAAPELPADVADAPVIVFSDASEAAAVDTDIPELINDTLPDLKVLAPEFAGAASDAQDIPELVVEDVVTDDTPELVVEDVVTDDTPEMVVADAITKDVPEPVTVEAAVAQDVPEIVITDSAAGDASDLVNADAVDDDIPELTPDPVDEPTAEFVLELEATRNDLPAATIPETERDPTHYDLPAATIPETERDPTLAELKPDLAALEEAMAFTRTGTSTSDPEPAQISSERTEESPQPEAAPELIPEITLDNAIDRRVERERADKSEIAKSEVDAIAQELAKAKSIEDIDDRMAETLFGAEFSHIASQVVAAGAALESAHEESANDAQVDVKVDVEATRMSATSNAAATELTRDATAATPTSGIDLGATQQRLNMVRELNSAPKPPRPVPELQAVTEAAPLPPSEPAAVEPPEPIENQINTSITQTLKALSLKDMPDIDAAEEDEQPKGGFFSRFKRS